MTVTRKRLHEHITDALTASAARILADHPDRADALADWLNTAHEHVVITAHADRRPNGRIDTRSLRLDCHLTTSAGPAPLVSVRVRDLLDQHGQPIDAQADARTLLLQLGHGIPNDTSTLD
jgi:hypothetical protein